MSSRPIRVLDLRESPVMGGPNAGLFKIVEEFAGKNEVEFVYAALSDKPAGWLFDRMKLEGLFLHWVPCYQPPDPGVLRRIQKLILEQKVNLVHTRYNRGDFYMRSIIDLGLVSLPTVITKHGMPPLYPLRNRIYAWLDKRPTRLANRVVAVDRKSYKALISDWKVPEDRVRMIHNPAPRFPIPGEEQLASLRAQLNFYPGICIALYLGRIEADKGIFDLLAAHEILHRRGDKFYTIYLGGGSGWDKLRQYVDASPYREDIRLVETQLDVIPYLALADLVILPSYFGGEGLPNVLLEAMAASKPIIATNIAGIPELIDKDVNGLMVPPKDIEQLTEAMAFLIKNPGIARQMGKKGNEKATKEFKVESVVDALINVYLEAADNFQL
jgi:glycosyltransferase involved in cell wall biosynthesis